MKAKDRKREIRLTRKIGDEIRRGLEAAGMKQIELARAIGVTEATVNRWANGKVRAHGKKRPMIDRVLSTDIVGMVAEHGKS
ncbi:MAG: helix-turn-helix transcriptional regulator [Proteobacteria bacterium]|nr:helix-turn-helix transcriptional regulator [Pseudomonadota bacterium]